MNLNPRARQNNASSAELRKRLLRHWDAVHGQRKADPECAGCRSLLDALDKAQKRERNNTRF